MSHAKDTLTDTIKLLSTIELEETISVSADIILQILQPAALGIAIWNSDLESAGQGALYGAGKKQFRHFFEAYLSIQTGTLKSAKVIAGRVSGITLPKELQPVHVYPLLNKGTLVGYLLAARPSIDSISIDAVLKSYPIALAISRAWEYKQLKQENARLRSRYVEFESTIQAAEEDTRELIHDVMSRDALNTRRLERDRLVFGISNTVRSSLQINDVLQNAVTEIGKSFGVTHCILLRPTGSQNQPSVYEWHSSAVDPLAEFFYTPAGIKFTNKAITWPIPQDLSDAAIGQPDRNFLLKLGLSSGLMIPLVLRDKVLGVILLKDSTPGREWSIDDTAVLGSLADQLSIAIENAELHQEREKQAVTDSLTGIANRRNFSDVFSRELERARRYGSPLSLVLLDLDYLKKINDAFGHQAGDEAIRNVARVLKESSRSVDLAARYGGEEFCLLLPNTDLPEAKQLAQRLRKLISSQHIDGAGNITASIGVATFPVHADQCDELFHKADVAMYHAKQAGRNRVCTAS